MAAAAQQVGRDPAEVRLVAVTKGQPLASIRALYNLGVRDFGENRPEQGNENVMQLGDCSGVKWHMIGAVQSRKAHLVWEHFNLLHSLDRFKLAQRLEAAGESAERRLPVLLQFNVSGEVSKSGWLADDENHWPELLPELADVLALPHLLPQGLMTMAPYNEDPEAVRPIFERLRRLRDYLQAQFPEADWAQLSMGMSGDFEAAIREGATLVRVGRAIFGE